jgi:hypothetical protein
VTYLARISPRISPRKSPRERLRPIDYHAPLFLLASTIAVATASHTHEDLQGLQPTPLINVIERNGNNIKCIKFRVLS